MPLLDLANELLCCISENLELERDINAFVQANRHLYRLLNTYLYRYNVRQFRSSALLWAAQYGQEGTAQKLLEERADDQAIDGCFQASLRVAAEKGHKEIVKLLLDKSTDSSVQDGYYDNALLGALEGGHQQIVKLLFDKGANVNA
ncbi:ankyrin, partial [Lindgomyces ingoldianus]